MKLFMKVTFFSCQNENMPSLSLLTHFLLSHPFQLSKILFLILSVVVFSSVLVKKKTGSETKYFSSFLRLNSFWQSEAASASNEFR